MTAQQAGHGAAGVRHRVVAFTFVLAAVLYLDRACLSILAPAIRKDMGIGPLAMGWVFSAFVWGYAVMHIPAGWLADRFGARRILTAIVVLWSAFTGMTGAAWNLVSLLVLRFIFGAAESGALPSVTRAFARWIPQAERARAQGFYLAGMSAGAAAAPPLVTLALIYSGWRTTFFLLGTLGIAWAIVWYWWFRDEPDEHPAVSAAEQALLAGNIPEKEAAAPDWCRALRSTNVWAILTMYFAYGYTGYISITWFPTYLQEVRHFTPAHAGFLAAAPSLFAMFAKPVGGWWSDAVTRSRGVVHGRKIVGITAFATAAGCVLSGYHAADSRVAVLLLSLADGATALAHGVCFAVCMDIGMNRAGTMAALMMTAGSLGNAASALVFGGFLQATGSWTVPFMLAAGADILAALMWLRIDPREKIV